MVAVSALTSFSRKPLKVRKPSLRMRSPCARLAVVHDVVSRSADESPSELSAVVCVVASRNLRNELDALSSTISLDTATALIPTGIEVIGITEARSRSGES